jgi:hypothetical protein
MQTTGGGLLGATVLDERRKAESVLIASKERAVYTIYAFWNLAARLQGKKIYDIYNRKFQQSPALTHGGAIEERSG